MQRVSAPRCDEAAAKVDASAASVGRSGGEEERRKQSGGEERRRRIRRDEAAAEVETSAEV
jgi:hypothetical protein